MKRILTALGLTLSLSIHVFAAGGEGKGGGAHRHGANLHLLPPPAPEASKVTRPSKVTLEAPKAMSKVSGGSATLQWSASTGADKYMVQVATDPNFKWLVVNEVNVQGTSYEVKGLETGKQYFWRVAGMKADNDPSYLKGDFARSMFEAQ